MDKIDTRRVHALDAKDQSAGPVIYWMSRDQRVADNWALLYARERAAQMHQPLVVAFCLVPSFLGATLRQYGFMLKGLQEVEEALEKYGIPFSLLPGDPAEEIVKFAHSLKAGLVVTDFDPLKIKKKWKAHAAKHLSCPLIEVDAHNIVPCWSASQKQEFGAYTLRPKIHKALPEFLTDFPHLSKQKESLPHAAQKTDWKKVFASLDVNTDIAEVDWILPGEKAAHRSLSSFINERLAGYSEKRNDPTQKGQSDLSPYLHFGQLSAQRVALAVGEAQAPKSDKDAFLEELIVRRELSDNFCYFNPHYDTPEGFPAWAKLSHQKHAADEREYLYTLSQFEKAQTHDPLWNAAQHEMASTGKMHGYMRMYWAKKILEWTKSPEDAMKIAIHLNDTYELDGRDPNGYTGIAWSIGGLHDRAWFERPVFGKIRYMNYNGCKSKFDTAQYISRFRSDSYDATA